MTLENVTPEELVALGRTAARVTVSRLDQLAENSDPMDQPLRRLLSGLIADGLRVVESLQHHPAKREGRVDPARAERLVQEGLPSASHGLGEGPLERDTAMYFAETLQDESSRFYRRLAEHATDGETRRLFDEMSQRGERQVDRLRTVLLAG